MKYMFNKSFLIVPIALFFCHQILAQKVVTTTELLSQCIEVNKNRLPYVENLNFYETNKQKLPIIDEVGFRTETDELDYQQQEYQLRLKFNSRKERQAVKRLVDANITEYKFKQDAYYLSKLSAVNEDIVNLYFIEESLKLLAKKTLLLADKKTVYLKLIVTGTDFDLDKWLSNEEEIIAVSSDSLQFSNLKKEATLRLLEGGDAKVNIQFKNWLLLDSLRMHVAEINQVERQSISILIAKNEERQALAELDLENAKARKWFDFAQVKYKGNEKNPWQEEISIGASFIIPLPSSNRVNRNEAALEVLESRYKVQLSQEKKAKQQAQILNKLNRLFAAYDLLQNFSQHQKLQKTYDTYLQGNNNLSPLDFIELKKAMLKQRNKQLKIEKEIYLTYIELLTLTGALVQLPLRNFLTNSKQGL